MTSLLNADLHSHSTISDGTLTPEKLAARAKTNGVELWALTDPEMAWIGLTEDQPKLQGIKVKKDLFP